MTMSAESLTAFLAFSPHLYIYSYFFLANVIYLAIHSAISIAISLYSFSVSMNVRFKAHMICGQFCFQYAFWKAYMTSKFKTSWVWGWQLHPIKTYLVQKPQYQHLACWCNPYSQQGSLMTPRTYHFNPYQYGPV